jgi:rare lipoprotein A
LSGKHADSSESRHATRGFSTRITGFTRFLPRRSVPLIAALTIAGIVLGASVAAMTLGPATDAPRPAAQGVDAAASARTGDERASRDRARVGLDAEPSPSPSPSGSPTPTPSKSATKKPSTAPSQPSGGGAVTSSGVCGASYYTGGRTASGEMLDPNAFTAAHKTLPFNTRVRVTNQANGKSVVVRIIDRGPYVGGRCLDLTPGAFGAIASLGAGVITVKYEVLS